MPYLEAEDRARLDGKLFTLSLAMRDYGAGFGADLNFVIHRIVGIHQPTRYAHWQEIIGALECAKQELSRYCAAYEDGKRLANGGIPGLEGVK